MDAGHINKTRKFPSYSIAELQEAVDLWECGGHPLQLSYDPQHIAALKAEIAARKAGTSVAFRVPQL